MTFNDLKKFLTSNMKMSQIYQPLLIKTLIDSGGSATIRQLAFSFLSQDESQLQYYEKRIKEMPVKVLSKHGVVSKTGDLISLNIEKLSFQQKAEIKKICEEKLLGYVTNRGLAIWDHRVIDEESISHPLYIRVLKDAYGRCALCGATKDDKPLHIDHIIPRSKGGKTIYENLQVLCATCNQKKSNKDMTDYRSIIQKANDANCVFCRSGRKVLCEDSHALSYAIEDKYPVSKGHTLIIPRRHVTDYFDLAQREVMAIDELIRVRQKQLVGSDSKIRGFNIGTNCGKAGGQTIFHAHVHLIPRYDRDVKDPRGGVRGVIPDKMRY